jgi:hypothetical protein
MHGTEAYLRQIVHPVADGPSFARPRTPPRADLPLEELVARVIGPPPVAVDLTGVVIPDAATPAETG